MMKLHPEPEAKPSSRVRPALEDIAELVRPSADAVGLLAYGSYLNGEWDTASDVDVICVSRSQQNVHSMVTGAGGVSVDVYASTRRLLEESIRSDTRTNNNFVLDAFAHGVPFAMGDDSAPQLASLAQEIWQAGPLEPSLSERRAIGAAVQKALAAAKRFAVKSAWSPEWREIAHLKCGYLFVELVHAYCRVHRLWASSLWTMLRWTSPQYQDLIAMCRRYLAAESFAGRVAALADLAEVTLGRTNGRPN